MYTFEELSDSTAAVLSLRHGEMRDAGKEIGKLLSSSNRILKVQRAWVPGCVGACVIGVIAADVQCVFL